MEYGKVYQIETTKIANGDWEEFLTLKDPSDAAFVAKSLGRNSLKYCYIWIDKKGEMNIE